MLYAAVSKLIFRSECPELAVWSQAYTSPPANLLMLPPSAAYMYPGPIRSEVTSVFLVVLFLYRAVVRGCDWLMSSLYGSALFCLLKQKCLGYLGSQFCKKYFPPKQI